MALVENDLGRDVLGRAAKGPRLAALVDPLREAKVHDLDVAFLVQEKILGLQVAVDDSATVKVIWEDG